MKMMRTRLQSQKTAKMTREMMEKEILVKKWKKFKSHMDMYT